MATTLRGKQADVLEAQRQLIEVIDEEETERRQERLVDLLRVLQDVPMTVDVLRKTNVGRTVNMVKKKLAADSEPGRLSRALIKAWKGVAKAEEGAAPSGSGTPTAPSAGAGPHGTAAETAAVAPSRDEEASPTLPRAAVGGVPDEGAGGTKAEDDEDDVLDVDVLLAGLPPQRKKVVDVLRKTFKAEDGPASVVARACVSVEKEINELHSYSADSRKYSAKALSLRSNMMKNDKLRESLLQGELDPSHLVRMSPQELATDDERQRVQDARSFDREARRTDWLVDNRAKVQKAVGVDDQGGEFKCPKCRGTKTTHSQFQTRSADEPITNFVTCMNKFCGHRWRTF